MALLFVLENLRDQLVAEGTRAIEAIKKWKEQTDPDGCLSKSAFLEFLDFVNLQPKPEELALIAKSYDEGGRFRFLEFLIGLRGQLNEFREKLVQRAFYKLDPRQEGHVTVNRIKEVYNGKCHPAVMMERLGEAEIREGFLKASFANLDHITYEDFVEYYSLLSSTIKADDRFEGLIMKHWKVASDGFDVEEVENKVKLHVYKNRIRIREFMRDFDKLRGRLITEAQFASGLDSAGVKLTPRERKALFDNYRVPEDPQYRVCWTAFCDEVDTVFTIKELEKSPLKEPPPVPTLPGLAPQRFETGIIYLGPEKEGQVAAVLESLRSECKRRRISVKSFFEDAVTNPNSSKAVGHVTKQQFLQALSSKAGLRLSPFESSLLVEKFDDLRNGMVNYVAFSSEVDPFLYPDDLLLRSSS